MESDNYNHPNMPGNWQKQHFTDAEGREYSGAANETEALRQHHLDAKAQQRDANKDIGGAELKSIAASGTTLSSYQDTQSQQAINFNTSPRREFEHYGSPFSYKDASDEAHQNAHIIFPTADDAAKAYEMWLHGDFPVAKAGWYGGAHPLAGRDDRTGVKGAPDRQHMVDELHTIATSSRKRAIANGENLEDWKQRKFEDRAADFIDPNAVGDENEQGLSLINLGDVARDRRKWMLEQIADGKLSNKALLHLPEGTKDAEVLQHFVNIHKGVSAYQGLEHRSPGGSPNVLEYEKLTQQERDRAMDAMEGDDPAPEELRARDADASPSDQPEAADEPGGANVRVVGGPTAVKQAHDAGEGVSMLRPSNYRSQPTDDHYGNPFGAMVGLGVHNVGSTQNAVNAHAAWLHKSPEYARVHNDDDWTQGNFIGDRDGNKIWLGEGRGPRGEQPVKPEQRDWILQQIKSGALDNKDLLYHTVNKDTIDKRSHAHNIEDMVNTHQGNPAGEDFREDYPEGEGPPAATPFAGGDTGERAVPEEAGDNRQFDAAGEAQAQHDQAKEDGWGSDIDVEDDHFSPEGVQHKPMGYAHEVKAYAEKQQKDLGIPLVGEGGGRVLWRPPF